MEANKSALLKEIMTYDFAANELTLFLDTHPDDKKALEMHKAVSKKADELHAQYNKTYGPLTAKANMSDKEWNWIEGPWPWEN